MTGTRDCPFCLRIAAGQFDYFDLDSVAFQPLNPVVSGHFLVVPRLHVSHVLEAPVPAGRALKFAGYLADQMGLTACNFITSAGTAATQTVFHLHIHVIPRHDGDGLKLPWTEQAVTPVTGTLVCPRCMGSGALPGGRICPRCLGEGIIGK